MHSHHSHSGEFCKHAKSTLDEVLEQAYKLKFSHFHLSEHVPRAKPEELYPEEIEAGLTPDGLVSQFQDYLAKARVKQREYTEKSPSMTVLVGCETENIVSPDTLDYLVTLLGPSNSKSLPPSYVGLGTVDYIVGSVHHTHGIPIDFDKPTYEKAVSSRDGGRVALLLSYLDAQFEVLQRLRPEVIGHMDLYRLFEPTETWYPDVDSVDGALIHEKLRRNIAFAASYGALFEANSAAFRKGWNGETYPGRDILCLILQAHGRIALSDDSHGVAQVGLNFARLRTYLMEMGVTTVWCLTRGTSKNESIEEAHHSFEKEEQARLIREVSSAPGDGAPDRFPRGTRAIPMREWASDPFWDALPAGLQTAAP
ncbi:histidinol phosphatase [Malassezia pachydermatis]|uniref:Histidinol-phosphatase n=1 Tax=Malassezia pachydermatis TaxID=77020 RepID=A0A0M8MI71_9BASI|nr:histidinol phosphate phosphatase h [Malassezia pachydermatis]KOS12966.1 histidinol phosphate phosphatase h [Malassezia pachydermatis]